MNPKQYSLLSYSVFTHIFEPQHSRDPRMRFSVCRRIYPTTQTPSVLHTEEDVRAVLRSPEFTKYRTVCPRCIKKLGTTRDYS